ncbi:MAG TPA: hypothetical protein VGO57_05385 [Verrucomicrobiae bacterium]|jgi:hypothetical protein
MIFQFYNAIRGYIGGMSVGLGLLGLLLFVFTIPLTFFGAHFWGGFGFREGPQPTSAQYAAAVNHAFWWTVWHRLLPQLVISLALVGYGLFEAFKEGKRHKV